MNEPITQPKNIGFIDIGTNSIRLALVQIAPNGAYTVLSDQKEIVRLGEGEFEHNTLTRAAIDRAVLVCQQFAEMARSNNAEEIFAVATSATREAKNQQDFIHALKHHANLDVKTISGIEEARLIYLGISDGFDLKDNTALMVDIGGGSTELIVGNHHEYSHLDSMKLGAIRVSAMFFSGEDIGPVSPEKFTQVQKYVRNIAIRPIQRVAAFQYDFVIGSSGTIENLANITSYYTHDLPYTMGEFISTADLRKTVKHLCELNLEERSQVRGISPRRGDIIIGGAGIFLTILEELKAPGFYVTQRTLRDGQVVDYLKRSEHASLFGKQSVQLRSVTQLAKKCGVDEEHSHHVKKLATDLFDSAKENHLHNLDEPDKLLLGYAALLHDVGIFLSYSNHHKHSYYLIKNADLVGFNQTEISIMAASAYFHRHKSPKKSRPQVANLNKQDKKAVSVISTLIRIAEALDRSHKTVITKAKFSPLNDEKVYLDVYAEEDYQLEVWRLNNHNRLFKKVFGKEFIVRMFDAHNNPIEIVSLTMED
ncbi:Ppx/GppA family phosphatase [bacterium]|nr:Ppx/GppA family phosphatase [bacterium]